MIIIQVMEVTKFREQYPDFDISKMGLIETEGVMIYTPYHGKEIRMPEIGVDAEVNMLQRHVDNLKQLSSRPYAKARRLPEADAYIGMIADAETKINQLKAIAPTKEEVALRDERLASKAVYMWFFDNASSVEVESTDDW